jgi:hypothetical protein
MLMFIMNYNFLLVIITQLVLVHSSSLPIKEARKESSEEEIAAWNFHALDRNKNKV